MCSNFIVSLFSVSLLLKHIHDVGWSSSSEYYQIEFDCEEWKWLWRDGGETETQFFSPQRPPKSVKKAIEFPWDQSIREQINAFSQKPALAEARTLTGINLTT